MTTQWLDIDERVRVELSVEDGLLRGLGTITVDGVALRANTVPLRPDFATLDAIHYQDFELGEIVRGDGGITIRTTAIGRPEVASSDLMDEYDFTLTTAKVRQTQRDELDWVLRPQRLELDGETFAGLSIGFVFRSAANQIHRFFTHGTWEIGGKATGNTIYHQSQVAEPVYTAEPHTHYTTACLKRLDMWDSPMGFSYQLCPRWGICQHFDFQSSADGALFGFWQDLHSVRSLIQKNPGEEVIFIIDEYAFEQANEVEIPAKTYVFSKSAAPRPKHEVVNLWTRANEHAGDIVRGFFGIELCRPLPDGAPSYAGKVCVPYHEVKDGPKDDWLWRVKDGKFYFLLEGDTIESHDMLAWMGDVMLPKLQAKGIQRLQLIQPVHESDFTALAFAHHAEFGWHSDLYVSSVCGSHRYVPAEFFGGWAGWRHLAKKAKELDMILGHWVGFHLTPRAPILREHPDWAVTHAHTKRFGGGYGHQCIVALNWRSGLRQWLLDDLARWHEEGLDFLWLDSWANLACLSVNYADNMAPMQIEVPKVVAELQKIGYTHLGFEGQSPFGYSAYGLADPMVDYQAHVTQGVVGQNDFGKRIGHEYMAFNEMLLQIGFNKKRDMTDKPIWSFRYIANRSLNIATDEHRAIYVKLVDLLDKRYLLPDEQGVRWESTAGPEALFAYKSFAYEVPATARVTRITAGEDVPVEHDGTLRTSPWTAYRIDHD